MTQQKKEKRSDGKLGKTSGDRNDLSGVNRARESSQHKAIWVGQVGVKARICQMVAKMRCKTE